MGGAAFGEGRVSLTGTGVNAGLEFGSASRIRNDSKSFTDVSDESGISNNSGINAVCKIGIRHAKAFSTASPL